MDEYKVRIGNDILTVKAEDNLSARYRAAEEFRKLLKLGCTLTDIVKHAKAKLVSAPESTETTEEVVKSLPKE